MSTEGLERCILEAAKGDALARNSLIDWLLECGHDGLVAEVAELAECGLSDKEFTRVRLWESFAWGEYCASSDSWTMISMPASPHFRSAVRDYMKCVSSVQLRQRLECVAAILGRRLQIVDEDVAYLEFH